MSKLIRKELVSINDVKIGDTVVHDGKQVTVGKESIKNCVFMGRTLFGDSYCIGYKPVVRLV